MIFVPVRFIKASIFVGEKQEDIEEETQALIRKMNQYFEQQPSPASSSSQSKDAQETSSNSLSENKDVPLQNPIFPWFFPGLDLNPARMVRNKRTILVFKQMCFKFNKNVYADFSRDGRDIHLDVCSLWDNSKHTIDER